MRSLWVTVAVCATFLAIDATPGLFSSALLCPCFSLALLYPLALAWVYVTAITYTRSAPARQRSHRVAVAVSVVCITAFLWVEYMPSRGGLWLSQGELDRLVIDSRQHPVNTFGFFHEPLNQWVGCFYVDSWATDQSGGVYFRTASYMDPIGFGRVSFGFAFNPHGDDCPFGLCMYRQEWMFGEWYWFTVSDA